MTLVEGWTFRQVRQALAKEDQIKQDTAQLTAEQIMAQLGRPGVHPEGRFFPDTYSYARVRATWRCCAVPCTPWTAGWRPRGRHGHQMCR